MPPRAVQQIPSELLDAEIEGQPIRVAGRLLWAVLPDRDRVAEVRWRKPRDAPLDRLGCLACRLSRSAVCRRTMPNVEALYHHAGS